MAVDRGGETGGRAGSRSRLGLAIAAALLSIAGTAAYISAASSARAVARAGQTFLVADTKRPVADPAVLRRAAAVLWHNPLDQDAFNIRYAIAVANGLSGVAAERDRVLLSRLGWRSTPAQQNLIAADIQRGDLADLLDRADSLLRRNRIGTEMTTFLSAVEQQPETRAMLADRLRLDPPWRNMFLIRGGELRGDTALLARAATMQALLDRGSHFERGEIAPLLVTMVVAGQDDAAYALWSRSIGWRQSDNLLFDGRFVAATAQGVRPDQVVPFEWQFGYGDGYSTGLRWDSALEIRWTGRGVPIFASQRFHAVSSAAGYRLTVKTDKPSLAATRDKLAFSVTCGTTVVPFSVTQQSADTLVYRASNPSACGTAVFTVSGRLTNPDDMILTIKDIVLEAADGSGRRIAAAQRQG